MNTKKNKHHLSINQQGQSLVEFVLLFLVTVSVSFAFLVFVNGNIVDLWKETITKIVGPTSERIEFR